MEEQIIKLLIGEEKYALLRGEPNIEKMREVLVNEGYAPSFADDGEVYQMYKKAMLVKYLENLTDVTNEMMYLAG